MPRKRQNTPEHRAYNKLYYERNSEKLRASRRVYAAEVRARNKKLVHEYKSLHGCVDCGERDPIVLDLDHRDRALKRGNVSELACKCVSVEMLQAELAKCDVRCANCHRRKTWRQRDYRPAGVDGGIAPL